MPIYRIRKFPAKLIFLILIISIISFVPELRKNLREFTFEILSRPLNAITEVKKYFVRVRNLSEENLLLRQRVAMQSVALARTRELSLENERLHALLDFEKKLRYKSRVARVIGRDSTDWRKSIIINKGKKHGIKPHMPCATAKGVVGGVAEVSYNLSKVMLITDPNSRIGVILEPSRESGVLVGFSEETCKVIYLSLDADIKKGDRVVTAGFSSFFPKGLAIGRVMDTAIEKTNLYKYAIVEPVVDMNKIEEVICIDVEE